MNRALRTQHKRRCAFRKHGGGYGMGAPLVPFQAADDFSFSVKVPINAGFSDCAIPDRPGQLHNEANPALAQAAWPLKGGACGCSVPRAFGGSRRQRSRKQRGGFGNGYGIYPAISVGGNGPNTGALVQSVPCDARAGSPNPLNTEFVNPDPRAPADLYSLTPNTMKGGSYGTGNAYAAECYKAPGSSLPVYNAETAGFRFSPSTEAGGALPDGVTPFNTVVPYAARMGGGKRKSRRAQRKSRRAQRKSRRAQRKSRRAQRKSRRAQRK
jgi:hypothetical protein